MSPEPVVHRLAEVDGEIVFDIDPERLGPAAGGTRLLDDVTVAETTLLARAMTYKFATFERRLVGAKAGIRARLLTPRAETVAAFRAEVEPMAAAQRYFTGPDMGTTFEDFEGMDPVADRRFAETVDGVALSAAATGHGVAAAAAAWLGDLGGRTVAIEGFGTAGQGTARAMAARGAEIVAVSTVRGAIADGRGFDVDELLAAVAEHGDGFVRELGRDVRRPDDLHQLPVDVLVPGARPGRYDAALAAQVRAKVIAPAANVPYTAAGRDTLRRRGVVPLADFVCNAGTTLVYDAPLGLSASEILARIDRLITERVEAARVAKIDPIDHAVMLADTFLTTWVPSDLRPDGPACAPEPGARW